MDLADKRFLLCLLDEAGQTSEPMGILSLLHAARSGSRLVLFGDEKQLCPTVKSKEALSWGLGVSILAKYVASIGDLDTCNITLRQC